MNEKITEKLHYIGTLILTLLALGCIVYYTFYSFYIIAKEDAVSLGEITVKERAESLHNFLLKGKEMMESTNQTVDYMIQEGKTEEELLRFLKYSSQDYAMHMSETFTGIYGVVNGQYLDGVGWVPDEDYVPQERMWYQDAWKGNGETVIGSPYVDAQTNQVIISISQTLSNNKGVMSMDIAMDEMQILAEGINLNDHGYGFIIHKTGLVSAHSVAEQKGKNYLEDAEFAGTDMQKMIQNIRKSNQDSFTFSVNEEECVVFYQVVEKDWYVVMVINTADLYEKVEENLFRNVIISLLVFIMVGYFCTTSYQNRVKAQMYASELKTYQLTLEERVLEQTQEIKRQATEMIKMQEDVIEGMATLIESRDMNTGEHVKNTKKYVYMIANYMCENKMHPEIVDFEYVTRISNAAALHDIGKIKISDLILNKPSRLTSEEFEVMKTHTTYGSEIVQIILGEHTDEKLLQIAIDMAKYHHEKWNGSGYPDGIKGEDIPLAARIMAVADVFDALISKRVYKDAMGIENAYAILNKDAGVHFDPEIIEIFNLFEEEIKNSVNE